MANVGEEEPKYQLAGQSGAAKPPGLDTALVHTILVQMKNITLSADEKLIEQARSLARERHTTLNQMFRDWLAVLTPGRQQRQNYREFMQSASRKVRVGGRHFTREEMNER